MQAIILAGGGLKGELQKKFPQCTHKAHLPLAGRMLVEHVLAALLANERIEKVFVVGDKDFLQSRLPREQVEVLQETDNVVDNFFLATKRIKDEQVLLLTEDIPLLTGENVEEFLNLCRPGADVYYPLVAQQAIENYDSRAKRTYVKLREGSFTGGNIFLVNVAAAKMIRPKAEEIFAKRKEVLSLVSLLGPGLVMKYLTGRLDVRQVQGRVGEILGIQVKMLLSSRVGIGMDVDKLADWQLLNEKMTQ